MINSLLIEIPEKKSVILFPGDFYFPESINKNPLPDIFIEYISNYLFR